MENIKTSLIFEEGQIQGFDKSSKDRDILSAMDFIESTLTSTIEEHKLSGRVELTVTDGRINVAYVGIKPLKYVGELIKLINRTP
jgi:hypothetical protein